MTPQPKPVAVRRWGIYRLIDGAFVGDYMGPARALQANTPAGCAAWPDASGTLDLGAWRVLDGDLAPALPAPANGLTAAQVRAERNRRLAACDWVALRAIERGEPVDAAWSAYRQALRDVPAQPDFPAAIQWPNEPEIA